MAVRLWWVTILAWMLGLSTAVAQVGSAELSGLVLDATGAAVAGASLSIGESATGRTLVVVTGREGAFVAAGLRPGRYQVKVEADGFEAVSREGVELETGDRVRLDITLTVAGLREQVQVSALIEQPARVRASLGAIVSNAQVEHLPLNGRAFVTLTALAPGVALPPGSQLPRINGGRPRTNEYLFDGISVLQPEPGQVAFLPVVDAIAEFRVETNSPPAEFGRFNGGVINLSTRSGSNTAHGTVFDFLRHESLNARNYFQSTDPVKPEYRRQQFGGTLGGPIVRGQTYFFGDYQGQRQAIGRTLISTVPTLLQRQGVFTEAIAGRVPAIYDPATTVGTSRQAFAANVIPLSRMDPVALALLQRYPLPTSAGTANNYRRTGSETDDQDQGDARVDQRLSSRDDAFVRVSWFTDRFTPVTPLPDGSGVTSGTLGPQTTTSWAVAGNWKRQLKGSGLNELRIGDTRRSVSRTATAVAGMAGAVLGLPGLPSNAQFAETLPTFLVSGYQQLGSPPNTASNFATSVTQMADTFIWLAGRHLIKAGFDWRWARLNVVQPPSPTGSFTFNALGSDLPGVSNTGTPFASFLLGQVQAFSIDLQQAEIRERAHVQEYFIQDDWRLGPRTTLSPGLRYTLNFPSTELGGQTAVFNTRTQLLEYPGTEPVRPLKKDNLGPRFGVVHRASDRTTFSAGYGLVWIEMAGITTPFTTPAFPFLQSVTARALDTTNPAFVLAAGPTVSPLGATPTAGLGQGVFAVDSTLGSGYVQQWNVAIQRTLTSDTTFEAAYVGSAITHVGIPDTNINQLTAEQLALGPSLLQRVPNPYFGSVPRSSSLGDPTITVAQLLKPFPAYTTVSYYRNNVGTTRYDGLELSLRRRFSRGLSYSASYTRSRLRDDASSVFDASILTGPVANAPVADSFDRSRERDYSTGDIPHAFVSSLVWDVPIGSGRRLEPRGLLARLAADWTTALVVTLQSGVPIAVTQATNFNAFAGFGVQRPNLIGDPELPTDERSPAQWFNTAAFSVAPQFTLGSASRNPLRGPAYRNVDLAVMRRVAMPRGALELRAEVFNLLNTPAFGAPSAVAGTASFGTITSAGDPRVVQLAARWRF